MWLHVELADVSRGSVVHFENVSLANISLSQSRIVSTTANDYEYDEYVAMLYYADDDADYDVAFMPVPLEQRSMFGEEFRIGDQIMSDCLNLNAGNGTLLPGCPPSSAQRRVEMAMQQARVRLDRNLTSLTDEWDSIDDYIPTQDDPWLLAVEAELGLLPPPPPGWPPFKVAPPDDPVERSSLTVQRPVPAMVPQLEMTLVAADTFRKPPSGSGDSSAWVSLVVVVALVAGIAAAAALWAARALRQPPPAPPRSSADVFAHPWPRRFPYWTVRLLPPDRTAWVRSVPSSNPRETSHMMYPQLATCSPTESHAQHACGSCSLEARMRLLGLKLLGHLTKE